MKQLEILGDMDLPLKEKLLKLGFISHKVKSLFSETEYFIMPDPSGKYFLSLSSDSEFDPRIKHCVGLPHTWKSNCFELLGYSPAYGEEGRINITDPKGRAYLLEEIRNIQSDHFSSYAIPRDQRPINTSPNPRANPPHRIGSITHQWEQIAQRSRDVLKKAVKPTLLGVGGLAGVGVFIEIGIFSWELLQTRNMAEMITEGVKVNRHVYENLRDRIAYLSEASSNEEINDTLGIPDNNL